MNAPQNPDPSQARKDRDFAREDTEIGFSLLTKGEYGKYFTAVVKVRARHGLIFLPGDVRGALRDAGIVKVPSIIPDVRVNFGIATANERTCADFVAAIPSLKNSMDLAGAMADPSRQMTTYTIPYGGVDGVKRVWCNIPFRTLVRATASPGRLHSNGQGFCLIPRDAVQRGVGTADYVVRKDTIVGLSTAVRMHGKKDRIGNEWVADVGAYNQGNETLSITDVLFNQLFQWDLNDLTWEAEKRPRRKGPLLKMFTDALQTGSEVYDRFVIAEPDKEEEGAEAAHRELQKMKGHVRLCVSCTWPLPRVDSRFCPECRAEQPSKKVVAPVAAAIAPAQPVVAQQPAAPAAPVVAPVVAPAAPVVVQPAQPAPVAPAKAGNRLGPQCPFNGAHNLRKPDSAFCDVCRNGKRIVNGQPVAPEQPPPAAPVAPVVAPVAAPVAQPVVTPQPRICEKCATPCTDPADKFCGSCGHEIGTKPVAQSQPEPAKPVVEPQQSEPIAKGPDTILRWCTNAKCVKYHKIVRGAMKCAEPSCGERIRTGKSGTKSWDEAVAEFEAAQAQPPQPGAGTPTP